MYDQLIKSSWCGVLSALSLLLDARFVPIVLISSSKRKLAILFVESFIISLIGIYSKWKCYILCLPLLMTFNLTAWTIKWTNPSFAPSRHSPPSAVQWVSWFPGMLSSLLFARPPSPPTTPSKLSVVHHLCLHQLLLEPPFLAQGALLM